MLLKKLLRKVDPTPEGDKYYNSVETYNIEIKKNEQDYFNHRQTHYERMNPRHAC